MRFTASVPAFPCSAGRANSGGGANQVTPKAQASWLLDGNGHGGGSQGPLPITLDVFPGMADRIVDFLVEADRVTGGIDPLSPGGILHESRCDQVAPALRPALDIARARARGKIDG
jgi:hypothetical protein